MSTRRFPAEWEPHAATWISWPHKEASWPGRFAPIPDVMAQLVAAVSLGERVHINVLDGVMEKEARVVLSKWNALNKNVVFHPFPTNDAWIRDYGPIFVREDDRVIATDWLYNSWGEKYPPWDLDNAIPQRIATELGCPRQETGMVLEGGSIDTDGQGTLLTTKQCLLHPNRNPQLNREQIEQKFYEHLGVSKVLWLGQGIAGDDTDGHIDDIARFVAPQKVVTAIEADRSDENYQPLQDNLVRLQKMTDAKGRSLEIIEIPLPRPIEIEGERVPASYLNFYIANQAVIVPIFNDSNDQTALDTLQGCFPDRKIVGIESTDLVWGLGAFHCLTCEQPKA